MKINNTSYLCGYFASDSTDSFTPSANWQPKTYDQKSRNNIAQYYMPATTLFITEKMRHYALPINHVIQLTIGENEQVGVNIRNIDLYLAPLGITLFAVQVDFQGEQYDNVRRALNSLRNITYYNDNHTEFVDLALEPIMQIYDQLHKNENSHTNRLLLIDNGNKFKIFQTASLAEDGITMTDDESSHLLFAIGSLSPYSNGQLVGTADRYYNQVIDESLVSVFDGWKGLSLLDTFTMLSINTPEWIIENWKSDYFGIIYIYQLFCKVFLYSINTRYRQQTTKIELLEKQLREFEKSYYFTQVSYNFLPNIINDSISRGLSTEKVREQLYQMINLEMETQKKVADEKTNNFLFFLTFITIFSAIYDIDCLLNEAFGFSTLFSHSMIGFRLFSVILMVIVAVAYAIMLSRKR